VLVFGSSFVAGFGSPVARIGMNVCSPGFDDSKNSLGSNDFKAFPSALSHHKYLKVFIRVLNLEAEGSSKQFYLF
jgi:hypothetical protein